MTTLVETGRIDDAGGHLFPVRVDRIRSGQQTLARVVSGTGFGALVIPSARVRGIAYVGVLRIDRPIVGTRSGLEFVRGVTADLSAEEAARELAEESSLTPDHLAFLGVLNPDSGLLDTTVGVWAVPVAAPDGLACLGTGHRDPESGSTFEWMTESTFAAAICSGKVTCGMTLAAWSLLMLRRGVPALPPRSSR